MTTVGTSTYGVILSSAQSSGPSGDICYFFCNEVKRKLMIGDKVNHTANQTSYAIVLKTLHYKVSLNNAIVQTNTISTLNSYHALMKAWLGQTTAIYLHIKDAAATYLTFDINGSSANYLKCRIVDLEDSLSNSKKAMNFAVEECST